MISIGGKLYYTDGTNIQGPAITHPAEIDRRRIRRSKYDTSHFFEDKNGNVTMEQLSNNIQAHTDTNALDLKYAKSRTVFSEEQMLIMETAYRKHGTPDQNQRTMIAELCGLAEETVRIWYQNRRAKEKRQHEDDLAYLAKKMTEKQKQSNELTIDQKVNNIFNANAQPDPSKVDAFRTLFDDNHTSTSHQRKRPIRIFETKTNKCENERKKKIAAKIAAKKVKLENPYEPAPTPTPPVVVKKKAQPKNISEVNFIKNLMREKDSMKPSFSAFPGNSKNQQSYSDEPLYSISYPLNLDVKEESDAYLNHSTNSKNVTTDSSKNFATNPTKFTSNSTTFSANPTTFSANPTTFSAYPTTFSAKSSSFSTNNSLNSISHTTNSTNATKKSANSYYQSATNSADKTNQPTSNASWDSETTSGFPKISNVTSMSTNEKGNLQPAQNESKREHTQKQQQQQQPQQQQQGDGGTYLNISADMTLQQMNDMILYQQDMIAYYQKMIESGELPVESYGVDAGYGTSYQDTTSSYTYDDPYTYAQQQQQQHQQLGPSSSCQTYATPSTNYDSTIYPHQKNFEEELTGMLNEYPGYIKTEDGADLSVYPKIEQQWSLRPEYSDQVCPTSSNISTASSSSAFTKTVPGETEGEDSSQTADLAITALECEEGKGDDRLDVSDDSCDSDDGSAVKTAMSELRGQKLDSHTVHAALSHSSMSGFMGQTGDLDNVHASLSNTSIKVEEEDADDAEIAGITESAEESRLSPGVVKEEVTEDCSLSRNSENNCESADFVEEGKIVENSRKVKKNGEICRRSPRNVEQVEETSN